MPPEWRPCPVAAAAERTDPDGCPRCARAFWLWSARRGFSGMHTALVSVPSTRWADLQRGPCEGHEDRLSVPVSPGVHFGFPAGRRPPSAAANGMGGGTWGVREEHFCDLWVERSVTGTPWCVGAVCARLPRSDSAAASTWPCIPAIPDTFTRWAAPV